MLAWLFQRTRPDEQSTMSTVLASSFEKNLKGKVRLYVPENNVLSLSSPRQKGWRNYLAKLIEDGGDILYIFTDAYEADKASLRPLKVELESHGRGTIRFCYFTSAVITDEEDMGQRRSLQTYHPVLAEDEHGVRMMWIENYHPVGNETLSFQVEMVGPQDASRDVRFDRFQKILDGIIARYGTE